MGREYVLTFDLTKDDDPLEECETISDLVERADEIEVVETTKIKRKPTKATRRGA